MRKQSFTFFAATLVVLAGMQSGYPVTLNGVTVPKDRLICYFFVGHSNMEGFGGGTLDTVTDPRVWAYSITRGFWNARDPVETLYNSPSPFMPFLKRMAELFPDYYFCGIKVTWAGGTLSGQFLRNMPKYTEIMQTIGPIKDSVTIGGIIAMFGWVEGLSDTLSQRFDADVNTMLTSFREDLGVGDLPLIMGRYEENADTTDLPQFYTYKNRIIAKLELLQSEDSSQHRIMLTPYRPIPRTMYSDSHHYSAAGYALWSNTAAEILYRSNWNTWYPQRSASLKLLFPSGGEHLAKTDRIPITWMCDPESLTVVFVQFSQDSGRSWSIISGDQALYPWIKTFYWIPSESGFAITKNTDLMVRIVDYDGKHSCRSNTFSLDSMITGVDMSPISPVNLSPLKVRSDRNVIELKLGLSQNYERILHIYSLQGRVLFRCTAEKTANWCTIPTSSLTSGTYILVLSSPSVSIPERAAKFILLK